MGTPQKRAIRPVASHPRSGRRCDPKRVGQLRRLSSSFCWRLFDVLLDASSDQLSSEVLASFRSVSRQRDVRGYFALDAAYGLQRMAYAVNPPPGNPAVIHMLVSAFRKSTAIELVPSRERRLACLTNVRLVDDALPSLRKEWVTDRVYEHARAWLKSFLGPVPDLDAVSLSARHGPGSTASTPYSERSRFFKILAFPYRTTPSARSHLTHCIQADARWASALEDAVRRKEDIPMWAVLDRPSFWTYLVDGSHPYNVVTTVPKDGRKDRPIAKEQLGNIYLQLGVGSLIRDRLRLRGIDLNRQQELNRAAAQRSSQTHECFTIDLSNASDTVSYDLVKALMPSDWFCLLDSLRAPWGVLPTGEAFLYRKFSSMGNGFTFELETILFLAICKGVSREYGHRSDRFHVFGDDIIGPDYLYATIRGYLQYSGFQVNSEKSFHGPSRVRESCGVDALDGVNIRPVFVKGTPQTVMEGVGLRNRIRSWFLRQLGDYPVTVDTFLLGMFDYLPPIGPDSDVEFDGWLQDGPWAEGRKFEGLVPTTRELPARDFMLRKLMHELRNCGGEGGNFLVTESAERVKPVGRVVSSSFDWRDYTTGLSQG